MLIQIISGIKKCISNDLYLAALSMALTIPDICGKAEYATDEELKNKTGKRYVQWFDSYIGQHERKYSVSEKDGAPYLPYISGELVYKLRNSVLHSGMVDVDGQKLTEEQNKVTKFQLMISKNMSGGYAASDASITRSSNGEELSREYTVSIQYLCNILCCAGEKYYHANKDKFDFFQYNIVDERAFRKS